MKFKAAARDFASDCSGSTAIEYATIGVLVRVAIAVAVRTSGGMVADLYGSVVAEFGS